MKKKSNLTFRHEEKKKPYFMIFAAVFTVLSIAFKFWLKNDPQRVEVIYSNGINKVTRQVLSKFSSLFEFSIGEVFIWLFLLYILVEIIRMIRGIINNREKIVVKFLAKIACLAMIIYSGFLFLWGINYERPSFSSISGLRVESYTSQDLSAMCRVLIERANSIRANLQEDEKKVMMVEGGAKGVFDRASAGYEELSKRRPELSGDYSKPKGIYLSKYMLYTGITGIYYPFTAEANVNTDIVDFMLPVTAAHEMAHQRGFAKEDEANFIAYLSCMESPDDDFRYSGVMLALINSMNELYRVDREEYINLRMLYSADVSRDLAYQGEFWYQYEGKIEEVSDNVNNAYLKSNGQEDGVRSYSMVVELLLAKYKSGNF